MNNIPNIDYKIGIKMSQEEFNYLNKQRQQIQQNKKN